MAGTNGDTRATLRDIRNLLGGISQSRFAHEVGVDHSHISRLEAGKRELGLVAARLITDLVEERLGRSEAIRQTVRLGLVPEGIDQRSLGTVISVAVDTLDRDPEGSGTLDEVALLLAGLVWERSKLPADLTQVRMLALRAAGLLLAWGQTDTSASNGRP